MKLMKTVKRIMALSTGAVMVGATVLSASAAADLSKYPAPFIVDGKLNGIIVVGSNSNGADVLGSLDVLSSLQSAAKVKKTVQVSGGTSVSASGGDNWLIGTSSKKLEFSESVGSSGASGRQETVQNITTFVTDDELPQLLADGTFRNDKGDFDYHQYLYFDNVNQQTTTNPASQSVIFAEDPDTDKTDTYFYVKNSDRVARYSLEFTTSAESTVTDSAGSAATTGTYLWNFEGKDITMLGKSYSIVKARRTSATGNSAELTLMGGAVKDSMAEGETKTFTVKGKDYEVLLDFVGSTTAKFIVNGESTDSMSEGGTFTLADKSQIGVKDISSQDFAGGVRKVEFYLGADKIFLKDTDVARAGAGSVVLEVGNEKIDDTKATITGSDDNSTFKIDTIQLNITADDDFYVPAGGKISGQMDEPQALLNAWDIEYAGLDSVSTEKIRIKTSGSNQYDLQFVDGSGNDVTVPLVYSSTGTNISLGDNDNSLIITENTTIARNDYFIVSDISQKQGGRRTYAVRYKGSSAMTDSSPVVKFQVLGETGTKEEVLSTGATVPGIGTAAATLKLGGATYKVWNVSGNTADFSIAVDANGDGDIDTASANGVPTDVDTGNIINITSKGGAQILISPFPVNGIYLKVVNTSSPPLTSVMVSVQTVNADDYDNLAPIPLDFTITAASAKVQFAENDTWHSDIAYKSPEGESNTNYAYTSLGAYVKWDNPSNDPDTLDVDYPVVQRLPLVYIVAPDVSIQKGDATEAGQLTYYEPTDIAPGVGKLANEVTDVKAQNAIVIGGPCANSAAAELMGNPDDCAAGFTAGKAMIQLFEHANGKVALLVAGYGASDTRRAARVLFNYQQWQESGKLKGSEVVVSGTSFTDISVAAPEPKPVAPVAPVAPEVPADDAGAGTTQ
ncbi:hypothetical protein HYU12_05075 [Candidatus Woesearchaeota archaeon]|nr:hypothetical protein [Candidatus Woesearchaeota archaeon]